VREPGRHDPAGRQPLASLRLPLSTGPVNSGPPGTGPGIRPAHAAQPRPPRHRTPIPAAFWLFADFAVRYGFCETMNGNWSQLDLTSLKVSATVASLALTVFWAMVTAGRVLFAVIQDRFLSRLAYHVLPFVLAGAFAAISALPSRAPVAGVLGYGIAAFGVGPLRRAGLTLPDLYGASAVVALALGLLSLAVAHRRPSPRSLHPRPQPMTTPQPASGLIS
jgi:hypothetical protein